MGVSEMRPNRYRDSGAKGCRTAEALAECDRNETRRHHDALLDVSLRCRAGQVVYLGVRFA
jgi:hypothetical protein